MKFEEFKRELIGGFRDIMKGRRPLRYIHYSTELGYVPRSEAPGHVRHAGQRGITCILGNNEKKRLRRAG